MKYQAYVLQFPNGTFYGGHHENGDKFEDASVVDRKYVEYITHKYVSMMHCTAVPIEVRTLDDEPIHHIAPSMQVTGWRRWICRWLGIQLGGNRG